MEIVSRPQPRAPAMAAGQSRIGAVVLAAGRSTRMGTNKLLAPLAGKPVVRHVVEAALASRARPVVVVTGHQQAEIEAALHGLDVRFVHNAAYVDGMSTSLKAGMASLPGEDTGCVVLLGDMPLVRPAIIDRLIDSHLAQPAARALVPVAGGRRGNPVLLTSSLRPVLAGLAGDVGARALLQAAGDDVLDVMVGEDEAVLIDVDTPEALERARSLAANAPEGG
jgi:molybdenum cofactor cytidylyltransferase